jgi:hypothetical protein
MHFKFKYKEEIKMAKIQKEDARKYMADVPEEYVFRCQDSRGFKNLRELRDGLANMTEEVYAYHANAEKNDFSRWVRDVIKDEKLAADLQSSTSRSEAMKRVGTRVANLSKK